MKYNYDIKKIGDLESLGMSDKKIAKELNYNNQNMRRFLSRNYIKNVVYIKKAQKRNG